MGRNIGKQYDLGIKAPNIPVYAFGSLGSILDINKNEKFSVVSSLGLQVLMTWYLVKRSTLFLHLILVVFQQNLLLLPYLLTLVKVLLQFYILCLYHFKHTNSSLHFLILTFQFIVLFLQSLYSRNLWVLQSINTSMEALVPSVDRLHRVLGYALTGYIKVILSFF